MWQIVNASRWFFTGGAGKPMPEPMLEPETPEASDEAEMTSQKAQEQPMTTQPPQDGSKPAQRDPSQVS